MNCYESAPEFIEEDNRRFRGRNPVSVEQMVSKHTALLPAHFVKGKTVLDLGCCLAATGHWALSHGAAHYTGVELQHEYAEAANRLMGKYHPGKFAIHQMPIEKWLAQPDLPKFDIVCILGVIYAFVDYFSILKLSSAVTGSTLLVEGLHTAIIQEFPNFCGVQFLDDQTINLATEHSSLLGRGTRVSPKGMEWLMLEFGFRSKGMINPAPIFGSPDIYNRPIVEMSKGQPVRYLMRFDRSSEAQAKSLAENLQTQTGDTESWTLT